MEELVDIHLNGQLYLYLSNRIQKQDYDIYYSNVIDDQYWNLAYLKNNEVDIKAIYNNIKIDMKKLNRQPLVYITSDIVNSKLEEQIKNSNLRVLYTDVWMILENLEQFKTYKSKIDFSVHKVNENLIEDFIQSVMDGFSGDNLEEPYGSLSNGYRIALRESCKENNSEYKVLHYLGKNEKEAIATVTVVYRKDKAILYNITTNKNYQKQGVCKQMMSEIIRDLIQLKVKTVCVQTEQGYYTEQVYKNMGFREILLGRAYMEE